MSFRIGVLQRTDVVIEVQQSQDNAYVFKHVIKILENIHILHPYHHISTVDIIRVSYG